jgi:hypothetical protein
MLFKWTSYFEGSHNADGYFARYIVGDMKLWSETKQLEVDVRPIIGG